MDAKEYLSQPYRLDRKIKSKESQLEALKIVTWCVSPTYGGEGGNGNRMGAPVEYAALRIVSLSNEIEEDRKNLVTMLEEIGSVINRLGNSDYVELMTMRYIMFLRLDDFICRMGYAQNTSSVSIGRPWNVSALGVDDMVHGRSLRFETRTVQCGS